MRGNFLAPLAESYYFPFPIPTAPQVCAKGDDSMTESGMLLMCNHCNVVAHKICIQRTHNDLPQGKDDEWDCR